MPFILLYLIKLSASLAVVFLFYYFILRKLTFYNHNRWYLLAYTALAFLIPFINISSVLENNNWDNRVVNWLPVIAKGDGTEAANESLLSAWDILVIVFITGVVIMFIRLLLQLFSFRKMIKKATIISSQGMSIYQVDENIIPFSFGNSIFINRHLHREDELQEIISHEFVHVKQRHSLDILWGELLCLFNWYNPFAWLLRRSIRQNLEFIADSKVLENGVDKKQYQYLLLKVIGNNQFSIAPKFNFSSLKKRIAMMNKLKTTKIHLLKFLFVLPVAVVMLLAFRNKYEKTQQSMPVLSGTAAKDSIPKNKRAVPQLPKEIEGISVMDANEDAGLSDPMDHKLRGMVMVKRKDGGKEIYDMGSAESKAAFEKKYGVKLENIVPPPPPPLAPPSPDELTAPPAPPTPPAPPAPVKLPANVKSININNNKATVELKSGHQENYDLNNAEQKKKFEIKYGEFAVPPPPPPANDVKEIRITGRSIPETRAGVRLTQAEMTERPIATAAGGPLYVINGVLATTAELDKLAPQAIASIDVLKGEKAIAAYGDKAKDGAVLIKTKAGNEVKVVEGYRTTSDATDKEITGITVVSPDLEMGDAKKLVILDGKELPATAKNLNGSFKIVSLSKEEAIKKYGEKGKNGALEITTIK